MIHHSRDTGTSYDFFKRKFGDGSHAQTFEFSPSDGIWRTRWAIIYTAIDWRDLNENCYTKFIQSKVTTNANVPCKTTYHLFLYAKLLLSSSWLYNVDRNQVESACGDCVLCIEWNSITIAHQELSRKHTTHYYYYYISRSNTCPGKNCLAISTLNLCNGGLP